MKPMRATTKCRSLFPPSKTKSLPEESLRPILYSSDEEKVAPRGDFCFQESADEYEQMLREATRALGTFSRAGSTQIGG